MCNQDLSQPKFGLRSVVRALSYLFAVIFFPTIFSENLSSQEPTGDQADSQPAQVIQQNIEKLCRAGQAERHVLLGELLEESGFKFEIQQFERGNQQGKNLIVDIQGQGNQASANGETPNPPWLILGAHLDRVKLGQGAVDNGGGCVTLIELMKRLRDKPLEQLRVTAVFFDLEENGLWGSAAYVKTLKEKPLLMINADVFAYGDQVWLYSPNKDHPLIKACQEVDTKHPFTFEFAEAYPPSDHLSFIQGGETAVSFSLLPPAEVQELEKMFGGDRTIRPKILQLIHTADDLPTRVQPANMHKGISFLDEAIRLWHAKK